MGMAASQARYLALVARKSNCEYEGQQINQSRLNLANQTANLFNQMLGLSVPVPPSTQDFTILQYSFTDGINPAVIDKWEQLATPDDNGYDYVVEYHYEANVYKGFQKKMNDPQVQFSYSVPMDEKGSIASQKENVRKIYDAQKAVREKQNAFDIANDSYQAMLSRAKNLVSYSDRSIYTSKKAKETAAERNPDGSIKVPQYYSIMNNAEGATPDKFFVSFSDLTGWTNWTEATAQYEDPSVTKTDDQIKAYEAMKAWIGDGIDMDISNVYFSCVQPTEGNTGSRITDIDGTHAYPGIALISDIQSMTGVDGLSTTLPVYAVGNSTDAITTTPYTIMGMQKQLNQLKDNADTAYSELIDAQSYLDSLNIPEHLGNTQLESLGEITQEEMAEIKQIMRTLEEQGGDTTKFYRCFGDTLNITPENYRGGIYKFERDGVTYFTTYYDLADTAINSEFMNDIDNQPKLNYYHANYVKENIYTTDKAVLDTDSVGRFKTVRFKDGSSYTLKVEEKTDDAAYQDAMNQYTYKAAEYDKMIQDINAKTSLIHQEDQQLELKLKQLDTEQSALSNEIEAVSKVVKDNVEKSFKTFGG